MYKYKSWDPCHIYCCHLKLKAGGTIYSGAAAMPNGWASKEDGCSESESGTTGTEQSSSAESVSVEEVPAAPAAPTAVPEPKNSPPAASPDRRERGRDARRSERHGRDKGKGSKGRGRGKSNASKCPHCWKKVKGGAAALQQHTWWNETCLAWQFFRQGYSWAKSTEMAQRLKEDRMVEGGPSDDDGPDSANPPPRPDKSWVPTRRSPPRRKEKKEKKHKEPKMWKVRKNEEKKRKKNKKSSRSPSPVRERKKRPPSSSSSGGGKKGREGRAKKEKPRTLVIRL